MSTPESNATASSEPFALVLKRRLVGLLVLLLAGFVLSLLLHGKPGGSTKPDGEGQALETIVVPLGGSTAATSAAERSRNKPQKATPDE